MTWGVLKLEVQGADKAARKTVAEMVRERWRFLEEKSALRLLPSQLRLLETWDGSALELLGMHLAAGLLRREVQSAQPTLIIEFREMTPEEFDRAEQTLKHMLEH